jgi:hypothetical protein
MKKKMFFFNNVEQSGETDMIVNIFLNTSTAELGKRALAPRFH